MSAHVSVHAATNDAMRRYAYRTRRAYGARQAQMQASVQRFVEALPPGTDVYEAFHLAGGRMGLIDREAERLTGANSQAWHFPDDYTFGVMEASAEVGMYLGLALASSGAPHHQEAARVRATRT